MGYDGTTKTPWYNHQQPEQSDGYPAADRPTARDRTTKGVQLAGEHRCVAIQVGGAGFGDKKNGDDQESLVESVFPGAFYRCVRTACLSAGHAALFSFFTPAAKQVCIDDSAEDSV